MKKTQLFKSVKKVTGRFTVILAAILKSAKTLPLHDQQDKILSASFLNRLRASGWKKSDHQRWRRVRVWASFVFATSHFKVVRRSNPTIIGLGTDLEVDDAWFGFIIQLLGGMLLGWRRPWNHPFFHLCPSPNILTPPFTSLLLLLP